MSVIAAVLLAAATGSAQEVSWKPRWADALQEAKTSRKLAVLVFTNKSLKDAVRFEAETLTDANVVAALQKYVCAKVDPDGSDDDNRLWQDHGMPRPPMSYVYDPDGKQLVAINSLNAKNYLAILNSAGPAYFDKIVPAREALAKDPSQPDRLVSLAEAYAKLDNAAQAAVYFDKAVTVASQKGDSAGALKVLEQQLASFYQAKWYAEARGCCKKLAELDPTNQTKLRPLAAWILGMADCKEGKWADAISGMTDACERYKDAPNLDQMLFTLGSAYMYAKDKDNALAVFDRIMKSFPDSETARIAQIQAEKLRK